MRWTPLAWVRVRLTMFYGNAMRIYYTTKAEQAIREGAYMYALRQLKRGLDCCLDSHLAIDHDVYSMQDLYEASWSIEGRTARVFQVLESAYGVNGWIFQTSWRLRTLELMDPKDVTMYFDEFVNLGNELIEHHGFGLPRFRDGSRGSTAQTFLTEWTALETRFKLSKKTNVFSIEPKRLEVSAPSLYDNYWVSARGAVLYSTNDVSFLIKRNNIFVLNDSGAMIWETLGKPFTASALLQRPPNESGSTDIETSAFEQFLVELARWRLIRKLSAPDTL